MAGKPIRRFTVRYVDGTVRSVSAQSHNGARDVFVARYQPPAHPRQRLCIWPQDDPSDVQEKFIGSTPKGWRPPVETRRRVARGTSGPTREQERIAEAIRTMPPDQFEAMFGSDFDDYEG